MRKSNRKKRKDLQDYLVAKNIAKSRESAGVMLVILSIAMMALSILILKSGDNMVPIPTDEEMHDMWVEEGLI